MRRPAGVVLVAGAMLVISLGAHTAQPPAPPAGGAGRGGGAGQGVPPPSRGGGGGGGTAGPADKPLVDFAAAERGKQIWIAECVTCHGAQARGTDNERNRSLSEEGSSDAERKAGVLYFSTPDHVWAIDARTGHEIWHYLWKSSGGNHLGNRGVAILGDWLYVETPDDNLVSLNIKDGTERWHTPVADLNQFYYASVAPVVVKNHVIAGVSGDDLDIPGYLEAHDPVTGDLQWRWYVVPQKKGDPGSETWPNEEMARHGGGMTWQPITYDPELNLIYVTTGNPQPVIANKNRPGNNLFTASIVALNPDTGKMVWYFQSSPHDTHDWDATQTAVLIDGEINGRPRKLIAQAARNGHFFVLDRTDGKAIVSAEYVKTNWSLGYDEKGQPVPSPAKMPQIDGALVSPNQGGAANWPPPSFSPATGLFYVSASRAFSVFYIYDPSDNPQGWGGTDRGGYGESMIQAIDYKTGNVRWSHKWDGPARSGLLSTAGNLLFGAGPGNALVALNATTGDALWHTRLNAAISNGPITYELDGLQYVIVGANDTLWAFVMNK